MPRKVQKTENSVPAQVKRPALIPPPADPDAMLAKFKDYPAFDVITRRFNDPNDPGSLPILLKEDPDNPCHNSDHQNKLPAGAAKCAFCRKAARYWHVRYFNLAQEGRRSQMRNKGYLYVEVSDLKDINEVSDLFRSKEDTFVRRGDRGQEVLGKIPLELYNEIKRRAQAQRAARLDSKQAMQDDLSEAAGTQLGAEAGDAIHGGAIKVERMTRHRTTLEEEATGLE